MLDLLVLLHNVARSTAACAEAVFTAIASQVVLRTNISTIHQWKDPGQTDACHSAERSALERLARDGKS
jgi:hypothetical protein